MTPLLVLVAIVIIKDETEYILTLMELKLFDLRRLPSRLSASCFDAMSGTVALLGCGLCSTSSWSQIPFDWSNWIGWESSSSRSNWQIKDKLSSQKTGSVLNLYNACVMSYPLRYFRLVASYRVSSALLPWGLWCKMASEDEINGWLTVLCFGLNQLIAVRRYFLRWVWLVEYVLRWMWSVGFHHSRFRDERTL